MPYVVHDKTLLGQQQQQQQQQVDEGAMPSYHRYYQSHSFKQGRRHILSVSGRGVYGVRKCLQGSPLFPPPISLLKLTGGEQYNEHCINTTIIVYI